MTVRDVALLALWATSATYGGEFNDFGLPRRPPSAEAIQQTGLVGELGGTLIVERTDNRTPIGTVSWRQSRYGPNPETAAWNIGIALIPEGRGHGFGGEAQRLLADHLFETTPVNRIEASTDIENHAEQRALEKAGFGREGVLRGAQYRAGAWHDLVSYAVTRNDW